MLTRAHASQVLGDSIWRWLNISSVHTPLEIARSHENQLLCKSISRSVILQLQLRFRKYTSAPFELVDTISRKSITLWFWRRTWFFSLLLTTLAPLTFRILRWWLFQTRVLDNTSSRKSIFCYSELENVKLLSTITKMLKH